MESTLRHRKNAAISWNIVYHSPACAEALEWPQAMADFPEASTSLCLSASLVTRSPLTQRKPGRHLSRSDGDRQGQGARLQHTLTSATLAPRKTPLRCITAGLPALKRSACCGCAGCEAGSGKRSLRACALCQSQPSSQYACACSPSPPLPLSQQPARGIVGVPLVGGRARKLKG